MDEYVFTAPLWEWTGNGSSWTFVTVPEPIADQIEDRLSGPRRGFGAVKVRVTVGRSEWTTSMFPSRAQASFILPIKRAVREAAGVDIDDVVHVRLTPIAA